MCYKIFRGGNLKVSINNGISTEKMHVRPMATIVKGAVVTAALTSAGALMCGKPGVVDVTTPPVNTDTTNISIYDGALGAPLRCGVRNGPACILDSNWTVFGHLPIQFVAGNDTPQASRLRLATEYGTLLQTLPAVSGADTIIDIGLERVRVRVDTVAVDSVNRYAMVSVTKVCNGEPEACAPTLWLDCGNNGKMTSACIPLGTVYHFGEYTIRLDAVDISTPTKLKVIVSVLKYDCTVAKTDTIPELVTDTLKIGTHRFSIKVENIHATILPDSTGALPKTVVATDRVDACATLTVTKECSRQ